MEETTPRSYDVDPFSDDFFDEDEQNAHAVFGRWGSHLFHALKLIFVFYSGAHNVNAALVAAGDNRFAALSQIVGVLVLELAIGALYMAAVGGHITGSFQAVVAILFWVIGLALASLGIVADSRLNAGQPLGPMLEWHLNTGLYLAPVIMIVGIALVVFSDPILFQKILNAKDRAALRREKVKAAVLAEKAEHMVQKTAVNLRLGVMKQITSYARTFFKSEKVQQALEDKAMAEMGALLKQAGVPLALVAPDSNAAAEEDADPSVPFD